MRVPAAERADMVGAMVRPLLRGWMHLVCFFLAVPAAVMVVRLRLRRLEPRLGAAIYGDRPGGAVRRERRLPPRAVVAGVEGADAAPRPRRRSSTMIAGTYTPVCLLVLEGRTAVAVLVAVCRRGRRRGAGADRQRTRHQDALRVVHRPRLGGHRGDAADGAQPERARGGARGGGRTALHGRCGHPRLPLARPVPRVFGYHEVWHTFVVVAVVCQFVALASVIVDHGA